MRQVKRSNPSEKGSHASSKKLRSSKCCCMKEIVPGEPAVLKNLLETDNLKDKTLHTEDGAKIPVLSTAMASLSPDFCEMIKNPEKTLYIPFSAEVAKSIVQLAYTGTTTISEGILEELLRLAKLYSITHLTKICGDFILSDLKLENCLTSYRLGQKYCCHHVIDGIQRFMCVSFSKLSSLVKELTMDELKNLIKRKDLNCTTSILISHIDTWSASISSTEDQNEELKALAMEVVRKSEEVIISLGGWDTGPTRQVEVYNSLSDTWVTISCQPPLTIAYHGLEQLQDKLYIIGGYSEGGQDNVGYLDTLFSLDSTLKWTELSFMSTRRCYLATSILQSKLVALGGHDGVERLKSAEIYDPEMNQWDELPDMSQVRSDFAATTFNERVYAIGGFNGAAVLASVECYDPATNEWRHLTNMVTQRSGSKAAVLEGRIYVLGGYDGAERLRSVECFTPGHGPNSRLQWHRVADMLEPRSNFSVVVMEGRLVVTGGYRQEEGEEGSVCAEVEVYCPAANRWSRGEPLQVARSALTSALVPSWSLL